MEGPHSLPVLCKPTIDLGHCKINYSKNVIEWSNGSKLFLRHCQHEKDVNKYIGVEIHVLMIDEMTQWSEQMYRTLRSCVRMVGVKVPEEYKNKFPRILGSSNPGDIGHTWVKHTFIDYQARYEISKTPKEEGGMLRQFIPALMTDNPSLMKDDPGYIDKLEGIGRPELIEAYRDGNWDIIAGGAVDDVFDRTVHEIKPFDIPRHWRVDRSFDWGSSKPYSVGFWAESDGQPVKLRDGTVKTFPRGTLFRIAEKYGWNGKPDEGTKQLAVDIARTIVQIQKQLFQTYGVAVRPGPADNSIHDVVNGSCIADDMKRVGVKWTRSDKGPGSRKNGLEKLRAVLTAAKEPRMEEPGLFVFNTCTHWLRTVPVIPRSKTDPEDVATDSEDHAYDETRYRLMGEKHKRTKVKTHM